MNLTDDVLEYAGTQYQTEPDRPWKKDRESMVLRHKDSRKWFALIMNVKKAVLGMDGDETVPILNLKCDPVMSGDLQSRPGILPAYHMNHSTWISVLLDGTVEKELVLNLLDLSFELTASRADIQNIQSTI